MWDLLKNFFRKLLDFYDDLNNPEPFEERLFPVHIDYGRSLKNEIEAGHYDLILDEELIKSIDLCNPTAQTDATEIIIRLIHFGRHISLNNARRKLSKMGYRPANARELLSFAKKYDYVQRLFPVIILTPVMLKGFFGKEDSYLLILEGSITTRELWPIRAQPCNIWPEYFRPRPRTDGKWQEHFRFAAVKIEN